MIISKILTTLSLPTKLLAILLLVINDIYSIESIYHTDKNKNFIKDKLSINTAHIDESGKEHNKGDQSDEDSLGNKNSESSYISESIDSDKEFTSINFEPTPSPNLPGSYKQCLVKCNKLYHSIVKTDYENKYTKLRMQFNISIIKWENKNLVDNRLKEIYKTNKLDNSADKIASAILLYEKLYSFYSGANLKLSFKYNFVKKLYTFMDWLASKNNNLSYLIQMPYIIERLLQREQLVTTYDLSKKFLLSISDQIWMSFLADNDFQEIFSLYKYNISISQQNMNIIKYKTLTISLKLFKLLCCYEYLQPEDCVLYLKDIKESYIYKTFNKEE